MNELLRDGLRAWVLGRDFGELDARAVEAERALGPREARRRLESLARRDDARLALRRIATDALGLADAHRLTDAEIVARVADGIACGRLRLVPLTEGSALAVARSPRILRETGRVPSAPEQTPATTTAPAQAAATEPAPGKKWPPDPDIPPEYPHMARLESAAIERARATVAVALDLFMFQNLPPMAEPSVPKEFPVMAKAQADALRDLAATLRAELRGLSHRRLERDDLATRAPAATE